MNILYLHQYFATPQSSGGTRSYEMARRLVAAGHQVTMVTTSAFLSHLELEGEGWHELEQEGIKVHVLNLPYSNRVPLHKRVQLFLTFSWQATLKARQLPCDLVFATSTPLTIAIPGVMAARRHRVPMVFEVRDLWPRVPIAMGIITNPLLVWLARALERFAYLNARRVVALSDDMGRGVEACGFSPDRISVIPNSADLELFDPEVNAAGTFTATRPELGDDPFILYPGTLGRVNGCGYLVELAEALAAVGSRVQVAIVGDGVEADQIRERAAAKGILGNNFHLYPPIPKAELVGAFHDAGMVISTVIDVPALEANSANKFFDGMAAGRPVAVNHGGWQKQLIESEDIGLALSRNVEQAAGQVDAFFADPERMVQAGNNARSLAERAYSRDLLAGNLEQVLLKALEEG